MAKVQTIVIKSPFGGWIPNLSGSAQAIPNAGLEGNGPKSKGGEQYSYSTAISLFRLEKLGHIAPGHVFTAASDVGGYVNNLALNADVDSTPNAWMVLKNMRIVKMNATTATTSASYDPAMAGTHMGHNLVTSNNPDVLVIKDLATTPVEYILWSVEDDTDADIALIKTDGSGEDDDFFSSLAGSGVLRAGVPLKMCIGPDAAVYITNGSYAAQILITGAIAAAVGNTQKLNFGPGWVATGVCAWKGYTVFIGSKNIGAFLGTTRGAVRVWLYNGTDDNYTQSYDIPDNYGNGIFSDGKDLWALTNGRNNSSKEWRFNGNEFVKENETDAIGVSSTPIQGSMEAYQDSLLVGTAASSQGRLFRFYAGGLHNDAVLSDGTFEASAVGMVKNLTQSKLFCGVQYGSGPTYKIFYTASFSQYYVGADFRTRLYEIGVDSTIIGGRIYFSQFGAPASGAATALNPGASVLLSLMRGYDTIGIGSGNDQLRKTISYFTDGAIKAKRWRKTISKVSSFYMNFRFNHVNISDIAAIIERVEIDWVPNIQ